MDLAIEERSSERMDLPVETKDQEPRLRFDRARGWQHGLLVSDGSRPTSLTPRPKCEARHLHRPYVRRRPRDGKMCVGRADRNGEDTIARLRLCWSHASRERW